VLSTGNQSLAENAIAIAICLNEPAVLKIMFAHEQTINDAALTTTKSCGGMWSVTSTRFTLTDRTSDTCQCEATKKTLVSEQHSRLA
jgi:hypothetical protein